MATSQHTKILVDRKVILINAKIIMIKAFHIAGFYHLVMIAWIFSGNTLINNMSSVNVRLDTVSCVKAAITRDTYKNSVTVCTVFMIRKHIQIWSGISSFLIQ